ncbi:MAG: helix-turn-helix transcriptional regulator [Alphaproteobacteria bacterium]
MDLGHVFEYDLGCRHPQRALAEKVGVNTAYLSQIETGKRGGSTKVLRAVAKALAVDLDDIVSDA